MSNQNDVLSLVGRILLALMFLIGGFDKIMGMEGTLKYMTANNLPMPGILIYAAILIEIGAGLLLVVGYQTRWAAAAFIVFILAAEFFFHQYWNIEGQPRGIQRVLFYKNLAVIGGMMMLIVAGPGRYSLDARRG